VPPDVITFAPHASAPLLIMEPSYTAVVLVDHKFQALSERFKIKTAPSDEIFDLKEKVKETIPISFSRFAIDVGELVVWKPMGETVINRSTSKRMAEILRTINVNGQETIEDLEDDDLVADLGLSGDETLLFQVPGTSLLSTTAGCVFIQF
jgi:hypothetical protein